MYMQDRSFMHPGALLPLLLLIVLLILAFEVWMIVDAALNRKISDTAKAWWIVGMILVHPFVAIVYFFTDHNKRKSA